MKCYKPQLLVYFMFLHVAVLFMPVIDPGFLGGRILITFLTVIIVVLYAYKRHNMGLRYFYTGSIMN